MKTTSPRTVKARGPRRAWYTTIACLAARAPAIAIAATTDDECHKSQSASRP